MFRSTTKVLKSFVLQAFASLGMRVFEPGGQEFESLRAHSLTKRHFGSPGHQPWNKQFELPTDNKPGSTTWPSSAKLDAAAQPRAIRPGALKNIFLINELVIRRPQKSTKNRASGK
jgi:hypothetical protein